MIYENIPAASVTGIGSLPFVDADRAVEFVARYAPRIPFWPQLPQRARTERMIEQGLCAFADLIERRDDGYGYTVSNEHLSRFFDRIDSTTAYLNGRHGAGFFAFEEACRAGRFPEAHHVKGHLTGPITQAYYLFQEERPALQNDAWLAALTRHIARAAQWQVRRLQRTGLPVMVFIDEHVLPMLFSEFSVKTLSRFFDAAHEVIDAIRAAGALAGLHCCFPGALPQMLALQPDILSFDAVLELDDLVQDPRVGEFLDWGGFLAFGLIPTLVDLDQIEAPALYERWERACLQSVHPEAFRRQSLVTATCGLGLLTEPQAARSFHLAHAVAQAIQRQDARVTVAR